MTRTFISGTLAALLATAAVSPALAQGNGNNNGGDRGRSSEARSERDDRDEARDEREERDDDRDENKVEDEGEDDSRGKARGRRDDNPGLGRIRSELKNLNAANASESALQNADPDSNVGQIATYRDTVLASRDSYEDYEQDYQRLRELSLTDYAQMSDEEIAEYVDTLDADSAEAAALTEYVESRETYSQALGAESTALTQITGERQLSEEALRAFRSELGLD